MASIVASDLVKRSLAALGRFGEGETLQSYHGDQARITLNNMFESWNIEGLTVYNMVSSSFPLVAGQQSYTIGSGGNINVARPAQIDLMYIRSSNIDYPIRQLSYNEWHRISDKTITNNIPSAFYYETSFTLGKIWFSEVPTEVKTVYYVVPQVFTAISALTESISYPDGYGKAIETNLAVELSRFYQGSLTNELLTVAKESKETLLSLNLKKRMRPANFDRAIVSGKTLFDYNTLTDVV